MTAKLRLSIGFTSRYGNILLSTLDLKKDADYFTVTADNVARYLDGSIVNVEDEAREAGEFAFIRPMLEFLIASTRSEIQALRIGSVQDWGDLTLSGAVLGGMLDEEWMLVFEYARQKLFGLDSPMTEDEKRKVKQEVTIIEESLEDFRARMRAEGRIEPPA